ncbi:MAG: hypothetical protein L0216_11305 [Planctomycetales bacterium]|nr:hypothetical protein [Planctomycetales bacterium]
MAQGADGRLRLETVATASCPVTEEIVKVGPGWNSGVVVSASCGHRHRATFEFGAWALEGA